MTRQLQMRGSNVIAVVWWCVVLCRVCALRCVACGGWLGGVVPDRTIGWLMNSNAELNRRLADGPRTHAHPVNGAGLSSEPTPTPRDHARHSDAQRAHDNDNRARTRPANERVELCSADLKV
jgi:hypothetical protein